MVRRSRAQAAETQLAPAAAPDEPAVGEAPVDLDPRDVDFERYVAEMHTYREGGFEGERPVPQLRADAAERIAAERAAQDEG